MDEPLIIPNDDKEWLVRRITGVKDKGCYMDILDLIHTGELDYTVNSNGIYFNLATVPDAVLHKITAVVAKYEKRK
jgi:hypothetical protein